MANSFVERCKYVYTELRDAQMARAEAYAIGYETEIALYFSEVERRVTYRDVMVAVAVEVRAERAAERAEVEWWQALERAHYAPYESEAHMSVPAEDSGRLFKNRSAAMVYALVCARTAARSIARPVTPSTRTVILSNGEPAMSTARHSVEHDYLNPYYSTTLEHIYDRWPVGDYEIARLYRGHRRHARVDLTKPVNLGKRGVRPLPVVARNDLAVFAPISAVAA